jgi:hypothetical protein
MIYAYLLPRSTVKVQRIRSRAKKDGWKNNGILAVNKKISVEALQILYRQNLLIATGESQQAQGHPRYAGRCTAIKEYPYLTLSQYYSAPHNTAKMNPEIVQQLIVDVSLRSPAYPMTPTRSLQSFRNSQMTVSQASIHLPQTNGQTTRSFSVAIRFLSPR